MIRLASKTLHMISAYRNLNCSYARAAFAATKYRSHRSIPTEVTFNKILQAMADWKGIHPDNLRPLAQAAAVPDAPPPPPLAPVFPACANPDPIPPAPAPPAAPQLHQGELAKRCRALPTRRQSVFRLRLAPLVSSDLHTRAPHTLKPTPDTHAACLNATPGVRVQTGARALCKRWWCASASQRDFVGNKNSFHILCMGSSPPSFLSTQQGCNGEARRKVAVLASGVSGRALALAFARAAREQAQAGKGKAKKAKSGVEQRPQKGQDSTRRGLLSVSPARAPKRRCKATQGVAGTAT